VLTLRIVKPRDIVELVGACFIPGGVTAPVLPRASFNVKKKLSIATLF
jgi:hypothetical protein